MSPKAFILQHRKAFAIAIIVVGILLRFLCIGSVPTGLNQDEASWSYDAWALLNHGIDRNGTSWPVLFISWGPGQHVLSAYLSMPFIAIFGLNEFSIRLHVAIIGVLTLLVFYSLARKLRGDGFGLLALFILATNPWHISMSRWALEANIMPFFLLLGIWLLVLWRDQGCSRYLILSAISFALALYTYGAAFIFLPIFFILFCIYLIKKRELRFKTFLPAALVFIAIATPITLCYLLATLGGSEIKVLGITLPELTGSRYSTVTVFSQSGSVEKFFENFGRFIKLLWTQNDGLPWNSINHFGLFYGVPGLIAVALGLLGFLYKLKKKAIPPSELLLFFALLTASLSAFLMTDTKINQINLAWLPIIYFQALGIYFVTKALIETTSDKALYPVIATIAILCSMFTLDYFTRYQKAVSPSFFGGLGNAIRHAEQLDAEYIQVTDANMPYIFVLFYSKIPPAEFLADVVYPNPKANMRSVSSFSKYRFGNTPPTGRTALISRNAYPGGTVIARYDNYTVTIIP
jgi:4-amino-4-deoxy-L-arabinose transferase-like glycosyltransferase